MAAALPACARDSDLAVAMTGPWQVMPELRDTMSFTVSYGNSGPERAMDVYLEVRFPAGVPAAFGLLTDADLDAIRATLDDDQGNLPLLFASPGCDAVLVTLQRPDQPPPAPLGSLEPGDGGVLSFTSPLPAALPAIGGLWIHTPPSVAGAVTELGRGACASCDDVPGSCFGEPLAAADVGAAELTLVDDGTDEPTLGRTTLQQPVTGKVALIDRGGCQFGLKAWVAEEAGAVGVIIANNGTCGDAPDSPDCVVPLLPGELGTLTTIPVVMVSQRLGDDLHAELDADREVMVTLGGRDGVEMPFEARIWSTDAMQVDPDPENDRSVVVPELVFFGPGGRRAWRRGGGRVGSP